MQLSDAEKKMVAKLRKRKQSFASWRWLLLLTSVFIIGCGAYCFSILLRFLKLDSAGVVSVALVAPFAYLLTWSGMWIMLDTLLNWHGRPEVDLLLRLVEESQDDA